MGISISLRSYPNGEIRLTRSFCRGGGATGSVEPEFDPKCSGYGDGDVGPGDCPSPHLDITSKLSGSRPGYGDMPRPTEFGLNAKRIMSRAAGVFDVEKVPREHCLFLTGTLPGSTTAAFDAIAAWSSWIVKAVKTWLNDLGADAPYSMYCWELQRRGALHLHYLVVLPDDKVRQRVLWKWAIKWAAIIDSVSVKSACDCWRKNDRVTHAGNKKVLQAPAQMVRKGVGAYLSKYLSKDASKCGRRPDGGTYSGPVRWWGVSRFLLAKLRDNTSELVIHDCNRWDEERIKSRFLEYMQWSNNRVFGYKDRSNFWEVFVTYCKENCLKIFNYCYRDWKLGYYKNSKCIVV